MRLAIVNLTGGGFSGGYRKYLQELLPRLATHDAVRRLDVLMPPAATDATRELAALVPEAREGTSVRAWSTGGAETLRGELARTAADVVFVPTQRPLRANGAPVVTMVRNMEPLVAAWAGNSWLDRARNAARWVEARRACHTSDRVLAVSEYVRSFLVERWKIPSERVGLVYHGLEAPVPPEGRRMPRAVAAMGGAPFLFTAGSVRPARGLEDLVRAWPAVRAAHPALRLVVAGALDDGAHHHHDELRRLAASLGVEEALCWAGALRAPEMAWCFEHAEAFVMTSRAEACPNIALEAMNYGALVVSTDGPPMPEFFRTGARYYEARCPRSLGEVIIRLLDEPPPAQEALRAAARARAGEFSWDRTVEVTVAELHRVIAETRR